MKAIETRPYISEKDLVPVLKIWEEEIGSLWPITKGEFNSIVDSSLGNQKPHHLVATVENEVQGFIGVFSAEKKGSIICLISNPDINIKVQLLEDALKELKSTTVNEVVLGSGAHSYFWPGIPTNLPGSFKFFQDNRFVFDSKRADLTIDLTSYETPDFVFKRLSPEIDIVSATKDDKELVLELENTNFKEWVPYYELAFKNDRSGDVLMARQKGKIVGTILAEDHHLHWEMILGSKTGSPGALGVANDMRRQGIGLALAAKATETLKKRGLKTSCLRWVSLTDWYGKLGYKVWRDYHMGSFNLE